MNKLVNKFIIKRKYLNFISKFVKFLYYESQHDTYINYNSKVILLIFYSIVLVHKFIEGKGN